MKKTHDGIIKTKENYYFYDKNPKKRKKEAYKLRIFISDRWFLLVLVCIIAFTMFSVSAIRTIDKLVSELHAFNNLCDEALIGSGIKPAKKKRNDANR